MMSSVRLSLCVTAVTHAHRSLGRKYELEYSGDAQTAYDQHDTRRRATCASAWRRPAGVRAAYLSARDRLTAPAPSALSTIITSPSTRTHGNNTTAILIHAAPEPSVSQPQRLACLRTDGRFSYTCGLIRDRCSPLTLHPTLSVTAETRQ